ncbi:MAG: acylphosphatase [Ancrocorticia sp.]
MNRVLGIDEAQVLHYRIDSRTLTGSSVLTLNAIVSFTVTDESGQVFRGQGEAQVRGPVTGDSRQRSLNMISSSLKNLHGRSLDFSSTTTARQSIASIMSELQSKVAESAARSDGLSGTTFGEPDSGDETREPNGALPRRSAGALFGIESALVNLAAQVLDVPEYEFLAGIELEEHSIDLYPIVLPVSLMGDEARGQILEEPAFADPDAKVWIDFGKRLTRAGTIRWIRGLLRNPDFRDSNQKVYLFRPLKKGLEGQYPELMDEVESALTDLFQHRVVVVADVFSENVNVPASLHHRTTFAIAVRPSAIGGMFPTLDVIRPVLDQGGVDVFLIDNSSGTAVARSSLVQLAKAHPSIKGVVSPSFNGMDLHSEEALHLTSGFWDSIIQNATVKIMNTGEIFRHTLDEVPNYFEEERYLGPVGPKGAKMRLLQKAALLAGFDTSQYSKAAFSIEDRAGRSLAFLSSATPLNSAVAKAICNHKETTRFILARNGVPVPQGRSFPNGAYDSARRYAAQLGYPVVVKPAMGTQGIGVVAGIRNEEELDLAFYNYASSRLSDQGFIVEKHLYGEEYRILVIGDKVVAAVRREAASVVGDGLHTVAELVIRKNRFRRTNPQLGSSPITYTPDTIHMLEEQDLTMASVPETNRKVLLSSSSNISQGGDSRELTDLLHPSVIETSIAAVKAVPGLNYCGVDFLLEDPSLPVDQQSAGILELNAQAATGTAVYPLIGTPRPVLETVIEQCIKMYDLDVVRPSNPERLSLQLKIRGRVTGVGYRNWFVKWAREFGVVGHIRNVSARSVEVKMSGPTLAVAALSAAAVTGPPTAKPTSVISHHIPELDDTGFVKRAKRVAPSKNVETGPTPTVKVITRKVARWLRRR